MIKADPLYEAREIQKSTGIQVLSAKDGMVIIPSSYSAKSSQKRLNLFKVKEEIVEDNINNREERETKSPGIDKEENYPSNAEDENSMEITEVEESDGEEYTDEELPEHREEQKHLNF